MKELLILVVFFVIWYFAANKLSSHLLRKGHKNWISKFGGFVGGFVIGFVFLLFTIPSTIEKDTSTVVDNNTAPAPAPAPVKNIEQEKTFDITPQEFAKRINYNFKKLKEPFRLKLNIESGEVNDTFNFMLNKNNGIIGTVDKRNGKLSGLTIITSGDGTAKSGLTVMTIVTSAYSALLGDNMLSSGVPAKIVMDIVK